MKLGKTDRKRESETRIQTETWRVRLGYRQKHGE